MYTSLQYAHGGTCVWVCVCMHMGARGQPWVCSSAAHLWLFHVCVCLCVCICVLVLICLCVRAFGGWRLKPGVFLRCFLPCSLSQVSQVNSELAASASLARQLGRGVHSPLSGLPHPPGTCMGSGHLNPVRQALPHQTVLSPTVLSEVGSLTDPELPSQLSRLAREA